jgi:hypothetical protein
MATVNEISKEAPPAYMNNGPDWEVPLEGRKPSRFRIGAGATRGPTFADRFDSILSPHKRYLGRSRRTFLIIIGVIFLLILALIIGLAVGLSHKSKYAPASPESF